MLLVICGAGASYDSVPAYPAASVPGIDDRPPLADQLFDLRPLFGDALRRYPRAHAIVPNLRERFGLSLEDVLAKCVSEASDYPERHKQLMAVRYYLQHIIWPLEHPWVFERAKGVTNYVSLLDQIRRRVGPDELVSLVTFNYDDLIEHALGSRGIQLLSIGSFVERPDYKLFKLHGSAKWCRAVAGLPITDTTGWNQWRFVQELTENAASLRALDDFEIATEYPTGQQNGRPVIPAIAIPIAGKSDFECPLDHLDTLKTLLPSTKKLIVVGWRAGEKHFLQILHDKLPPTTPALIACGSHAEGAEAAKNLSDAGIDLDTQIFESGFTEMILKRSLDAFLRVY